MSVNIRKLALISLCIGLAGQGAFPETVYVCEDEGEGGSTLYSEKPCKTTEGVIMHFPDSYSVGTGLSELERKNLSAIEARERQEKNQEAETVTESEKATLAETPSIDQAVCDKANADLKQWKKVMSLGYLPEEKEYYLGELQIRTQHRDEACGLGGR